MSTPRTPRLRQSLLALFVVSLCPVLAQAQIPSNAFDMRGTVGPYRVGAQMRYSNDQFLTGYYFYASQLKDIPLTQAAEPIQHAATLSLTGADGSTMHLHFTGNGSEGAAPLTFNNSVALDGTWTLNNKTLPVHLGFSADRPFSARRYADVTSSSDQVFEAEVRQFRQAILANDRNRAARFIAYPLRINSQPRLTIRNSTQLKANWTPVFTPAFLGKLRDTIPHDMFVRNGEAMLGDGLVWFNSKGASSINP